MNYKLLKDVLDLLEEFEMHQKEHPEYAATTAGFRQWVCENPTGHPVPEWEGKSEGRSAESVINTLLVHLNRYAKLYSKAAMQDSEFSTQEEFIYLINLQAFGEMSKIELIRKNVQEKSVGMQTINRLIGHGWIDQKPSKHDKRSKVIRISAKGQQTLAAQMDKIRMATRIVTGNLSEAEKLELIRLLQKLEGFHQEIFPRQIEAPEKLEPIVDAHFNSIH